jgi:hypothetical protein
VCFILLLVFREKRERLQCFFQCGLQFDLFELSDSDLFVIFGKFFENGVEVLGDKHSDPVLKIYEWFEFFCGNCYNLAKLL